MQSILTNIRVLDFGRFVAGPFCSSLLGDLGADVIRIDRVENEANADRAVLTNDESKDGAAYLAVNRNKKSISLDLKSLKGREILTKLIETADVVVANMPSVYLKQIGVDFDSLVKIKSDIILASVNGFGYGNDAVAFDGVAQFMSGAASVTGQPDHPVKAAVAYCDYGTAISTAYGVLAAIIYKLQTGKGQHIHCSLMGTGLMMNSIWYVQNSTCNIPKHATGNASEYIAPTDLYKTLDGYVYLTVMGNGQFKRWASLVGQEELIKDPRYRNDVSRGENRAHLNELTSKWCLERTNSEVIELVQAYGIPVAPMLTLEQAAQHKPFHDQGFFQTFEHPHYKVPIQQVSNPVKFMSSPYFQSTRPPLTGEHTTTILSEIGYTDNEINVMLANSVVRNQ